MGEIIKAVVGERDIIEMLFRFKDVTLNKRIRLEVLAD